VKVNATFPGAQPALRGVICLHSGADGGLLAQLDSATITACRTGLAAALGTHVLTATTHGTGGPLVGVMGAGAQAELMVKGLRHFQDFRDLLPRHGRRPGRGLRGTARWPPASRARRRRPRDRSAGVSVVGADPAETGEGRTVGRRRDPFLPARPVGRAGSGIVAARRGSCI
jgi:hypothetical protein